MFKAYSGFGGSDISPRASSLKDVDVASTSGASCSSSCFNPAERFGFGTKGQIAEGYDVDIALVLDDSVDGPRNRFELDAGVHPVRGLLDGRSNVLTVSPSRSATQSMQTGRSSAPHKADTCTDRQLRRSSPAKLEGRRGRQRPTSTLPTPRSR